jgi:hypothetical protein
VVSHHAPAFARQDQYENPLKQSHSSAVMQAPVPPRQPSQVQATQPDTIMQQNVYSTRRGSAQQGWAPEPTFTTTQYRGAPTQPASFQHQMQTSMPGNQGVFANNVQFSAPAPAFQQAQVLTASNATNHPFQHPASARPSATSGAPQLQHTNQSHFIPEQPAPIHQVTHVPPYAVQVQNQGAISNTHQFQKQQPTTTLSGQPYSDFQPQGNGVLDSQQQLSTPGNQMQFQQPLYSDGNQVAPLTGTPSKPIEGAGIDARTGLDPKVIAEQHAMAVGGAPGAAQGRISLILSALACKLVEFVLNGVLENATLAKVKDPAAAKVHAVELLKLLTMDPAYGMKFKLILEQEPAWRKYKSQDHSLFISGTEQKADYFLTDGSKSPTKLLTEK